ncbi:MAG TPA: DUF4240 domain-containing protein [Micromonosporaceae bacterium]
MRTDDFWGLIERARSGAGDDPKVIAERAAAELARAPADIIGFDRHLARVLAASNRVDLWGAAYLINGGASDDGFDHFRGWLLGQGRSVFARAAGDPDSLADLPAVRRAAATGEEFAAEMMLGIADEAYRRATGRGLPPAVDPLPRLDPAEFWDFDDEEEARRRLPRLAELFLEPPDQ